MKKLITLALLITCCIISASAHAAKDKISVLFIGNSLTYVNGLPKMIANIAKSKGKNLYVESHVRGGAKLRQHATDQKTYKKISSRKWDYVVLQEQSQFPSFSERQKRKGMYPFAQKLATAIQNNGSTLIYYMTMARKNGDTQNVKRDSYSRMQARINKTYYKLAATHKALVAPVGIAWRWARHNLPNDELYADPIHPNKTGSYLAACAFYSTIFADKCTGANIPSGVKKSVGVRLQQIADHITSRRQDHDFR